MLNDFFDVYPKDRQVGPRALRVTEISWPYIVLGADGVGVGSRVVKGKGRVGKGWVELGREPLNRHAVGRLCFSLVQ